MEVEWHYNGTVIPDVKYLEYNKNFIRIVNIIHYLEINNTSRLWEKVRTVRFNWMMKRGVEGEDEDEPFYANINQVKTAVTADHLDEIEKSLDIGQKVPTVPISGDVADDVLAEAVAMYIYLIDYPSARLIAWIRIYSNFFKKIPFRPASGSKHSGRHCCKPGGHSRLPDCGEDFVAVVGNIEFNKY